jgi:GDPmannose 4,6-dehydratase
LNYKDYLVVNPNFFRPTDIHFGAADPSKANNLLDWRAQVKIETVIENMCIAARDLIQA